MKNFEFAGFIPMNKESIFDDPEPPTETFGIVDFDSWTNKAYIIDTVADNTFVDYIRDNYPISGYMIGPTALYNGETLTAKTIKIKDPGQLLELFSCDDHKKFLYSISYSYNILIYETFDSKTGLSKKLDKPIMTTDRDFWFVRFASLASV